jgi:hypothetical protein
MNEAVDGMAVTDNQPLQNGKRKHMRYVRIRTLHSEIFIGLQPVGDTRQWRVTRDWNEGSMLLPVHDPLCPAGGRIALQGLWNLVNRCPSSLID